MAASVAFWASGLPCAATAKPDERDEALPVGRPVDPTGAKSYFALSRQDAHQRQRMACAVLGEPTGAGFYSCIADLQAAMFRSTHPSP